MLQQQPLDPTAYGHCPVPPLVFGGGATPSDDFSRWTVVYPHYLDSAVSRREGRRVPLAAAVAAPEADEICAACDALCLRHVREDKCYPRDSIVRGRVRVIPEGAPKTQLLPALASAVKCQREAREAQRAVEATAPSKAKKKGKR